MASKKKLLRHDSESDDDREHAVTASAKGGRMQELLASYYGMQRGVDRSSDVESTKFDVKSYVKGLLKNDKVETLLRKDESMVREVKKLDSDMQTLVYENYNKFISATDTIRKMAQNVEEMETEMTDLKSSMDRISESSAKVNGALAGNRSKMNKLVRVRRLLQRLDFLFQLPQRLEDAVQEGQYAKAVRYFSMTKDILRKHSHVSSFGAIQTECEDTMRRLQDKLQKELDNPDVPRDTLVSHADILLRLGVDPGGLKDRYLEAHRRQLNAFISASKGALVEDGSVSLDACLGKLVEGFLPMLLRTVQIYAQLFQGGTSPPSTAVPSQGQQQRQRQHHGDPEEKTAQAGSSRAAVGDAATAGAAANSRRQQQGGKGTAVAAAAAAHDENRPGDDDRQLTSLIRSSVDSFFGLLYAKVKQTLDDDDNAATAADPLSMGPQRAGSIGASSEDLLGTSGVGGEGGGLDAVKLGGVVAAVQQLVSDMETVDPHVPQVELARRAKEFAQEFKRGQVRRSFRVLCRSSLAVATSLVDAIRTGTPPEDLLVDAFGGETGGGGGSGSRHNYAAGGGRKWLGGGGGVGGGGAGATAEYPALVERALETLLKEADGIVSGARPLSRLDSSPAPLFEELRFGLWGVVLWLASALGIIAGITPDASTETLPSAEGREYEVALEEEWGLRAVAALEEPFPESRQATPEARAEGEVVLLLACLCRGLGTTYVVRVPEILSRQLPASLDQSMHNPGQGGAPQQHPPQHPHFSSSTHSASTLQSGVTDRSLFADDVDAVAAAASAAAGVATGGGMLERRRHLDAVRNRVSVAALSILEYYAENAGRGIADVLQVGLDAPPEGGEWFSVEEPRGVGEAVLDALELAEDSVKEVCTFLGEGRTRTVSVTRTGDRDLRRGSSFALGGGGGGVRRDIDRIFEGGAAGVGPRGALSRATRVSFGAEAMLAAIFRVVLKAFGERTRFLTLPGPGFRQVELDADFLRQVLPFYVAERQMLASLDGLLGQALQSAADRSLDPTPMDTATAGDIVARALDSFK